MIRKSTFALATAATLGTAALMPTAANATWYGYGGYGYGKPYYSGATATTRAFAPSARATSTVRATKYRGAGATAGTATDALTHQRDRAAAIRREPGVSGRNRSRTTASDRDMRITDIRETSIALNSTLQNSSIDFSEMTTSVVAVITDVKRDGKPVTGYAFNSTGRYACGAQMRARFIPRILKADPKSLLNAAGDNFDPAKVLAVMMRNEKSGGHSERSIGIGTIEVAVWDAVAKIAGKPLHALLAERFGGDPDQDKVLRLCRRRLVRARQGHSGAAGRDEAPSRCRLHHGEDEGRRRAARRGHAAHRGGEEHPAVARRACGRCQLEVRPRRGAALRQGDGAVPAALVRGAVRSARLCDARRTFRTPIRTRSRPARTCSRRRTWRTSCASAT